MPLHDTAASPPSEWTATARPNRRTAVLAVAARMFDLRGYDAASMRDIAAAAGLRASSLYHFFPGKDALFAAVYAEGVRQISVAVRDALDHARARDPWARLERACAAHLATLLAGSDFTRVVVRTLPLPGTPLQRVLREPREHYESLFRALVRALPLAPRTDRRLFRLALLGALNWSITWYRPDGPRTPASLARGIVALLRAPHAGEAGAP